MSILIQLWPLLAVLLFALVIYTGVCFYVCRDFTGTWNGLRFMLDSKYWSFAVLNHDYAEARDKGMSVQDFIREFSAKKLLPKQRGVLTKMRESERKLLVMLLSQEDFLVDNFGTKIYDSRRHRTVSGNWYEHLKQMPYGEE